MKNNSRPISNGSKGFPKHTVCMSGYRKKTNKKYNSLLKHILFVGLPISIIINVVITIYLYITYLK